MNRSLLFVKSVELYNVPLLHSYNDKYGIIWYIQTLYKVHCNTGSSTNFQQRYHYSVLLIFLVIWLNNRRKGKLFLWVLKFRVVYFYSGSTGLSICADLMGRGPDPLRKIKRIIFIYTCSKVTKNRSWIISLFIYYNQKGWSRPNLSILNSSATIFRTSCKINGYKNVSSPRTTFMCMHVLHRDKLCFTSA